MPYINVEIDLGEIDFDDLIEEVEYRIGRSLRWSQLRRVKDAAQRLMEALDLNPSEFIQVKTLPDKLKYEYLCNVFGKYSLEQIEAALPVI